MRPDGRSVMVGFCLDLRKRRSQIQNKRSEKGNSCIFSLMG